MRVGGIIDPRTSTLSEGDDNDDTHAPNDIVRVVLDLDYLCHLHHVASEGMVPRLGAGLSLGVGLLVLLPNIAAATSNRVGQIGQAVEQDLVVVRARIA